MIPDTSRTPASVIVVSRHRAAVLTRCLTALGQQDHPGFEVIVVADPQSAAAVRAQGMAVKLAEFDEPNISAARNIGLGMAAGEVVAFIDDDAVAEPSWLSRLCSGFANPDVVAATGFVRGRNGISYQWQACEVNALGQDHPIAVPLQGITLRAGTRRRAVKTQGTNCAFRRGPLLAVGGFDPALRFYLDEADVNLRLGGMTAVVPLAQVHHGYLASAQRRADRVPLSLHEIAASTAVFLRRHADPAAVEAGLALLQRREADRIATHLAARRITRADADRLTATLLTGWSDGLARALHPLPPLAAAQDPFQPLPGTGPRPGHVITGRLWQRRRLLAQARAAVTNGCIVTVICLSPSPRAHWMQFTPEGYWLQEGGLFGRADRDGTRLRLSSFSTRIGEEIARWSHFRPIGLPKNRR